MIGSNWNDLDNPLIPWVKSFNRIVKSSGPPYIHGDTILISSDYSGEHPKSKYTVYSLVAIDLSRVGNWNGERTRIRAELLANDRRISFKSLNDAQKKKAIPSFVRAANSLHGLMVNVVINKKLTDINYSGSLQRLVSELDLLEHKWKVSSFNRMATLLHFVALTIGGMIREMQNVYWYSDEDNIFSNERMSRDVSVILGRLSSMYVKVNPGELGIGTTKLNEKDYFEEDLNSISDLAAGTLSEFFDKVHSITDQNSMGDFAYKFPQNLTDKTQYLIDWVTEPSRTLKKVTVVFDRGRKAGSYKIWRFDVKIDPRYT